MTTRTLFLYITIIALNCCGSKPAEMPVRPVVQSDQKNIPPFENSIPTIHVMVALCDNQYQGIVPVPARIGNGQDPVNNLYWGAGFGISTYFKKSSHWQLIRKQRLNNLILERLIFKHKKSNYYLVADAYDGQYIKNCTVDFLKSCSGAMKDTVQINDKTIGINGHAKLISYIGHDGLMDFSLTESFVNTDNQQRDAIILACISKKYFAPHLRQTNTNPLVWTTGLMAPEAYTLHDALESYIAQQPAKAIQLSAARAYSKYQQCSIKAASNLLASGY